MGAYSGAVRQATDGVTVIAYRNQPGMSAGSPPGSASTGDEVKADIWPVALILVDQAVFGAAAEIM
jgi:hypothetical protein